CAHDAWGRPRHGRRTLNMLQTTAREIADLTGGALVGGATGDELVTGTAVIDSREIAPGDLFAAFRGEHVDGHSYLNAAREAGAALALVSEDRGVPAVQVDDVREALSALARAQLARARQENPQLVVLAVTGSAGKTGTKDLLGTILAAAGPTVAPAGSLNNELGLPLTVLRVTAGTRFLVLEMGARGIGHIAQPTAIARARRPGRQQGPAGRAPRGRRSHRGPRREPHQRARPAADRAARDRRDPFPGARDGRARDRPHRPAHRDRPAGRLPRAQRRLRPP